jgi:hypothetical protein
MLVSTLFAEEPEGETPISLPEIVVEAERKPLDPTRESLNNEEITKIPGTGGDLITSIFSLPGVVASSYGADFYVRGSGPFDNQVLLDQVPVILPFHFVGFISTINADFIKDMDFYAGGFSARYGNAMGSIIDLTSREGRKDRVATRLNISPVIADLRLEGPVGTKGSFIITGRDGLIEHYPLAAEGEDTVIPIFSDYQAKLDYELNSQHRLSLLSFGSHDDFSLKYAKTDPLDPAVSSFGSRMDIQSQGISLRSAFTPHLSSELTLFHNDMKQKLNIGPDLFLIVDNEQVHLKDHFIYDLNAHTITTGFDVGYGIYGVRSRFVRSPTEGEADFTVTDAPKVTVDLKDNGYGGAYYLEDKVDITPHLETTYGIRFDYFSPTDNTNISPRISLRATVAEDQQIKVAYGHYYQWPERNGEFIEGFGTPTIEHERAIHYILGYENRLTSNLDLDIQTYYKDLNHLIVPSDNAGVVLDNDGIGISRGVELLLRHRLTDRFFGWVSYAYSDSIRKSHAGDRWHYSDYDRPHSLTLLGNYQLNPRWNIGTRFQYVSGEPFTPLVSTTFDPAANSYQFQFGDVNSSRLPPTHRLDLRIEYKKQYDRLRWTGYFEIWNVYNRLNPVGISYVENKTEKNVKQEFATLFGILPFFGISVEF